MNTASYYYHEVTLARMEEFGINAEIAALAEELNLDAARIHEYVYEMLEGLDLDQFHARAEKVFAIIRADPSVIEYQLYT